MLLRELVESITLSQYHHGIKNDLFNIVIKNGDILSYLKSKLNELSSTTVNVALKKMPKGDGAYVYDDNTLYINTPVIQNITRATKEYITATSSRDTKKHQLLDYINRLVAIFLHELTHVIQISKSEKPYEKSYVYNKSGVDKALTHLGLKSKKQRAAYQGDKDDLNLKKLNVYLARLGDPRSEINMAVDRAQPEEISAYANQTASEILATLDTDSDNRYQRTQLRNVLKKLKMSKNNLTKSIEDYKIVNKYSKKAHDKFFKQLYLQLMNYYDSIS